METLQAVGLVFGAVVAGISVLFTIGMAILNIVKMFGSKTDKLENERIKDIVDKIASLTARISHLEDNLSRDIGQMHEKINHVRESQLKLEAEMARHYLTKEDHNIICNDRKKKTIDN